ncbi:ABC transporter [Paenibacillus terrae HPL-003]|uniref:ABC transporter n=1 Tax=Paenibacillus terrae (strain HPL-003) TaxID=985665 RepID=G7VWB3_PAETH|nr:ATP-binding cassette domain-containing protein [Paenibacillus terrae]AET59314.1 ABC transporter [Paenibacillus terrae HPL-003]
MDRGALTEEALRDGHLENPPKGSNGRGCRNVTITVGKGEAFGFLGPNGAGKSTFVKMLVGLIHPTAGEATLIGAPIGTLEAKRQIGYLPELYRYQEWLTDDEVVRLHGRLCGMDKQVINKRVPELLHMVGVGQQGKTIFLNSHLLEDVEVLCDRMALLNNGQVLRHGG